MRLIHLISLLCRVGKDINALVLFTLISKSPELCQLGYAYQSKHKQVNVTNDARLLSLKNPNQCKAIRGLNDFILITYTVEQYLSHFVFVTLSQ